MKAGLYPRLAWDGIRKNKKFYLPYMLTCVGMVMMFYIIHYLAAMPALSRMRGGVYVGEVLGFGFWIVALFSVIFLLYTNSFLMRRRKKEFGLYNMLGMGKRHLSVLLIWESLILLGISMVGGLAGGILLSKLAELCLLAIIDGEVTYELTVDWEAFADTWRVFLPIFAVIFFKSLVQLRRLNAVALMKSESVGEKPPKANFLLGIAGIVILAGAYAIALSIKSPLAAMGWFFIAVAMVIVATYLLFISGSVLLCRILQRNKGYYYQKNHFVSVASMVYRMKRNGAGLASICILSTMVLVMMMGAGSLYFGKEDSLNTRYPYDISVRVDYRAGINGRYYSQEGEAAVHRAVEEVLEEHGVEPENPVWLLRAYVTGMLRDGTMILDPDQVSAADATTMNDVAMLYLIPLDCYNQYMGTQETLEDGEVMVYCVRRRYDESTLTLCDGTVWRVKKQLEDMIDSGDLTMNLTPSVYFVVPNLAAVDRFFSGTEQESGYPLELSCSFDTDISPEAQIELSAAVRARIKEMNNSGEGGFYSYGIDSREEERADYYSLNGGVFFLGIFLSIIFLAATILIIYYKQVTEGYEDESRFEIMRKVGMTPKDIRKNINSQMFTVFFLPLLTAALHVGFAFPMVQRLLMMFNLRNVALSLIVTALAIAVFGLFYAVVYRVTSNAYYAIVSGKKEPSV